MCAAYSEASYQKGVLVKCGSVEVRDAGVLTVGLPYPGNLLPGYPPGNTTGTRVPDRKRK